MNCVFPIGKNIPKGDFLGKQALHRIEAKQSSSLESNTYFLINRLNIDNFFKINILNRDSPLANRNCCQKNHL